MKQILVAASAVLAGAVLVLCLAPVMYAQQPEAKKAAAPKLDRISGTVQDVNKNNSTITVRQGSSHVNRMVVYSPDTKISRRTRPGGTIEELKQGTRVICLGKFDEKSRLLASRIDIR